MNYLRFLFLAARFFKTDIATVHKVVSFFVLLCAGFMASCLIVIMIIVLFLFVVITTGINW